MSRIVCWFSCGVASAVATKLAIAENNGRLPLVAVRNIVHDEHPDNERFTKDCEEWFDMPIIRTINKEYNGSVDAVIEQRKYMSGIHGAPCTLILKKAVRLEFQTHNDIHVLGYCSEEQDRWDDFLDANNISARAPLIERGLQHSDCLAIVQDAGIDIPAMYKLGYKHNNCIGCVKAGGQGYWNKIRVDFPDVFAKRVEQSRKIGCRLLNVNNVHKFLDEIVIGAGVDDSPSIQCGIFCEMAKKEIAK